MMDAKEAEEIKARVERYETEQKKLKELELLLKRDDLKILFRTDLSVYEISLSALSGRFQKDFLSDVYAEIVRIKEKMKII